LPQRLQARHAHGLDRVSACIVLRTADPCSPDPTSGLMIAAASPHECRKNERPMDLYDTHRQEINPPPAPNLLVDRLDRLEHRMDQLTKLIKLQVADWLSIEHAAIVCDCSYEHIYRAVERGDLPASDIGNGEKKATHRISRSDLKDWMEKNKGGKKLPPRSELKDKISRYLPGVA
jgi:excisionase family DNA binding protein